MRSLQRRTAGRQCIGGGTGDMTVGWQGFKVLLSRAFVCKGHGLLAEYQPALLPSERLFGHLIHPDDKVPTRLPSSLTLDAVALLLQRQPRNSLLLVCGN